MANVSVIDISVNAAEWENFRKGFSEFNKKIQEHPTSVIDSKKIKESSIEFKKMANDFKMIAPASEKSSKHFEKIGLSLRDAKRNVLSITGSLMKWGSLLALGGGLSLFGMSGAVRQRAEFGRNASLSGTNVATERYLSILANSGTGLISAGMLGQAKISATDRSKQSALAGIGMTDFGKYVSEGSAQILAEALPKLFDANRRGGGMSYSAKAAAEALGVPQEALTMDRQAQWRMISQANLAAKIERSHPLGGADNKLSFGISELQQKFKDMAEKIGVLVLPAMIKFGNAVNKIIGVLLDNPEIKNYFKGLQNYISGVDFKSDVNTTMKVIHNVKSFSENPKQWLINEANEYIGLGYELSKKKALQGYEWSKGKIADWFDSKKPAENMTVAHHKEIANTVARAIRDSPGTHVSIRQKDGGDDWAITQSVLPGNIGMSPSTK